MTVKEKKKKGDDWVGGEKESDDWERERKMGAGRREIIKKEGEIREMRERERERDYQEKEKGEIDDQERERVRMI